MPALIQLSQEKYESVVRWRQRTGSQLAGIVENHATGEKVHMRVFLGNKQSDRPLATPLFQIASEDHEVALEQPARELWKLPWMTPHEQIQDFLASLQEMRIMVVASAQMSPELIQELLDCVRDNVDRDMPDYLLTA